MDHDLNRQHTRARLPAVARPTFGTLCQGAWCLAWLLFGVGGEMRVCAGTFQIIQGFEEIAERGKVPSYLILTESNRFSFLPPPGWNVSHSASERKVTLVANDLGASLSFSILPAESVDGKAPTLEGLKNQLLVRFPDAKILRDFPVFGGGQAGQGIDLERLINKKTPVSMRVAIVHFPGGKLEFILTAASPQFPKYHRTFGNLLGSFRVGSSTPSAPPKK